MLLTLLQQNLEPIRARVSWLQFVALPTATLSATDGSDVLTSAASAESRAKISWLQFVPGTAVAVDGANAPDTLVSMASIEAPVARVSWVHFTAVPDGVYSAGSLSPDVLTASASAAITVKISWLLLEISPSLSASVAGNDSDSLFASATVRSSADPHVAGSWSPASLSRWMVLDTPNPPPTVVSAAIAESGDVLTASAVATPPIPPGYEIWEYVMANGQTAEDNLLQALAYANDLAKIHGLVIGSPLVVTPTSRTAADIVQTIADVAGPNVTVERTA